MFGRHRTIKEALSVLLPPAVGYSFPLFIRLLRENKVEKKYVGRIVAIMAINIVNLPFRFYEQVFINPRIRRSVISKDPIFILGHWRSGTTHLHNLLSQDPQMGYVTTYQSVFPDTVFNILGRFIFRNFTALLIPITRKGDNVKLNVNYPQEEEFALGSHYPLSYYYFWMFPEKTKDYFDQLVRLEGLSDKCIAEWKEEYLFLIKKALKNKKRPRFLSKNPPNTGRIGCLLEMFPNAKFIHIYRNPVEVFLSTRHFFSKLLPHLQLHSISEQELEENIFYVYKKMMHGYLDEKHLIPEQNLYELRYEDFLEDPLHEIESIYRHFEIEGFNNVKETINNYLARSKSYKKNIHHVTPDLLEKILKELNFAMALRGYDVPENLHIDS